MHEASFLSAVMGLIFVLGLILLLSWLLKRFGSPVLSGCLEHLVNALALRGEEGRSTLRKAAGRREHPVIRGYPNGATHRLDGIL